MFFLGQLMPSVQYFTLKPFPSINQVQEPQIAQVALYLSMVSTILKKSRSTSMPFLQLADKIRGQQDIE